MGAPVVAGGLSCPITCGILVPQLGIERNHVPCITRHILKHRTTRESFKTLFNVIPYSWDRALSQLLILTSIKPPNDQPRQHIKNQRHYFANKGLSSQSYGFSSNHVQIWVLESVLKEISPEYSLEGLMLKLKYWNSNTLATWCEELTP